MNYRWLLCSILATYRLSWNRVELSLWFLLKVDMLWLGPILVKWLLLAHTIHEPSGWWVLRPLMHPHGWLLLTIKVLIHSDWMVLLLIWCTTLAPWMTWLNCPIVLVHHMHYFIVEVLQFVHACSRCLKEVWLCKLILLSVSYEGFHVDLEIAELTKDFVSFL